MLPLNKIFKKCDIPCFFPVPFILSNNSVKIVSLGFLPYLLTREKWNLTGGRRMWFWLRSWTKVFNVCHPCYGLPSSVLIFSNEYPLFTDLMNINRVNGHYLTHRVKVTIKVLRLYKTANQTSLPSPSRKWCHIDRLSHRILSSLSPSLSSLSPYSSLLGAYTLSLKNNEDQEMKALIEYRSNDQLIDKDIR